MANTPQYLAVFDFETTGKKAETCFPIQIAVKMYGFSSLEPIPNGEWASLCRPDDLSIIEPESLEIHKIPLKTIEAAPNIKQVWPAFIEAVQRYNPSKNKFTAPVPGGYNIRGYDMTILRRMNDLYCKKEPVIFSDFRIMDLMDLVGTLFDCTGILPNYKFDTVREFFGINPNQSHLANMDARHEGALLVRILKYMRGIIKGDVKKFENSFTGVDFGQVSY